MVISGKTPEEIRKDRMRIHVELKEEIKMQQGGNTEGRHSEKLRIK